MSRWDCNASLLDTLLGIAIGARIDVGESDKQILTKCEEFIRQISAGMADPRVLAAADALSAELKMK